VNPAKTHSSDIIIIIDIVKSLLNFDGSFIDACKLNTTPLPSKLNTATPKKYGNFDGENKFIFLCT
jgi:hypothetical protein